MITYYAAESLSWYSRDLLKQACTPLSFQSLFITPASSAVIKPSSAAPASTKSWRASSWTFKGHFYLKSKKTLQIKYIVDYKRYNRWVSFMLSTGVITWISLKYHFKNWLNQKSTILSHVSMFGDISNSYQGTRKLKQWRDSSWGNILTNYPLTVSCAWKMITCDQTEDCILCLPSPKCFLI